MSLIKKMSFELGVEPEFVLRTASSASRLYKIYYIPKRTGGRREIAHPSQELKALQRWIVSDVLRRLPVHPAVTAYEPGAAILRNARLHQRSNFLLRMDFEKFFPSITSEDVKTYLGAQSTKLSPDWSSDDSQLVASLCCRHGALTIGAPTSPMLSNRICLALDSDISALCEREGVTYSRYADDMYFSTRRANVLVRIEQSVKEIVDRLSVPSRLTINASKTRNLSKRNRRVVTGLVLGSDGEVSIGRKLKRHIRSMVYHYDDLDPKDKAWLRGMLAYCRGVEPAYVSRLYLKFGSALVDRAIVSSS